jgi:two-component system response regulator (stage 0 sporulation protein A)
MFTLEQKIDMVMRYIATADKKTKGDLKKAIAEALATESKPTVSVDIDDMVFAILKRVGMPPNLKGYNYTDYAIKLCLADPSYLDELTKRLYPDVAVQYNTTDSRVERAIRHAVESVFDRCDPEIINNLFGCTMSRKKGKLTNGEFIASCVSNINHALKG